MGTVFVSYRRQGAHTLAAAALAERLGQRFGRERIFIDTRLNPGERYPDELKAALAASDVVIAVIDAGWVAEFAVERRTDWVRHELSTALRDGKTIIPVLLEQAAQPSYDEVPAEIAEVTLLQSTHLRSARYESDVEALAAVIERTPAVPAVPLATADLTSDRRMAVHVAVWAILFALLALRFANEPRLLVTSAISVVVAMACLTFFVLVMALARPTLEALTRRHQERSFVTNLKDVWPLYAVYLLVVGILWSVTPLFEVSWLSTEVKVLATGVVVIAFARVAQRQVREVTSLDTAWPPTVTPDTLTFRRAATRLHDSLTAGGPPARDYVRQRQAESVLRALADVRAALDDRARLTWRGWFVRGHPNDPVPAAIAGMVVSVVALDGVWVVIRHATPVAVILLALGVVTAAVTLAAVVLAVSFYADRRHSRGLATELREWDERLRPLVYAETPDR